MTNTTFEIASKVEDISLELSCVIKTVRIVIEEMGDTLAGHPLPISPYVAHLLDCSDAVYTGLWALDRIYGELNAVIETAYAQKKEG